MRYRPFGRSGSSLSCVGLNLGPKTLVHGRAAARNLITQALELGINTFQLETPDPVLADLAGEALGGVDRRLICVSVRLGSTHERGKVTRDFSAESITGSVDHVLAASGLSHLDLAVLDEPGSEDLPQNTLSALKAMRSAGRILMLGVAGDADVMDAYVTTNAFDVLETPFDLNASWQTRNRIRAAVERDMAVIGYNFYPESVAAPAKVMEKKKRGFFGLGAKTPAQQFNTVGTFDFLQRTPNWSAEEICLAYALSEPTLASVMVDAADERALDALAAVPERDLPPGVPAQIEMARVSQNLKSA